MRDSTNERHQEHIDTCEAVGRLSNMLFVHLTQINIKKSLCQDKESKRLHQGPLIININILDAMCIES